MRRYCQKIEIASGFPTQNRAKTWLNTALVSLMVAGCVHAQSGVVVEDHVLPDISLQTFVNGYLPGAILANTYKLGGVGSGIWHGPGDGPGIFWMITDRGPNPQTTAIVNSTATTVRAFPEPGFTPFILKVRAEGGTISILEAYPIVTGSNGPATGLPNDPPPPSPAGTIALGDEQPYSCTGAFLGGNTTEPVKILGNVNGHDTEDIVRDVFGNFWTIEEYGPSITKIDATGHILKRFVPRGRESVMISGPQAIGNLPEILGKRPRNRGFEGLAITPDQKTLMAIVQSPLTNPSATVGNRSRVIRLIAFDVVTEMPTAEYVYVMQGVNEFAPSPNNPTEMKISSIASLDQWRFIVDERTDLRAKIFRVDIRNATNILGSKWDLLATSPSLESFAAYIVGLNTVTNTLAENLVQELGKELVLDLGTLRQPDGTLYPTPQKIEGMTVLNGKTIAFANDNDFGVSANCTDILPTKSRIFIVNLDHPIRQDLF